MSRLLLGAIATGTLIALPAAARQPDKPITERNPSAVDVAKTPVTDLNVGRDNEIPPLLIAAAAHPYTLDGLRSCKQLATAIENLDELLGPDIDLPQEARERISGGRVAQWVVASFIPFRGLIREISGANEQDRRVNAAIQAGLTRRGFLKGVGANKGCGYPAAPAPDYIIRARLDEMAAAGKKIETTRTAENETIAPEPVAPPAETPPTASAPKITFTSQPVVQSVP